MMMSNKSIDPKTMNDLKELVYGIVTKIVDHPEAVEVNVVPSTFRIVAELHTHVDDLGHVIGRNAHIITSIRSILSAFQGKAGVDCEVIYVTDKQMQMARRATRRAQSS